ASVFPVLIHGSPISCARAAKQRSRPLKRAGVERRSNALRSTPGRREGMGPSWKSRLTSVIVAGVVTVLTVGSMAGAQTLSSEERQEVLTHAGAGLSYQLGVQKLDGVLRPEDTRFTLFSELVAQAAPAAEPEDSEASASELNRKLTNPVSSIWSLSNQFNTFKLENGHWNNNWLFQPVLPVSLTRDWNLITRPVMPFYNIVPHETA